MPLQDFPPSQVGSGAPTGLTAGQIVFPSSSTSLTGSSSLIWDNTNKRLGINNGTPAVDLDVTGTGHITVGLGVGTTIGGATAVGVLGSQTIASATSAVWDGISFSAATATISGSTNITTATGFNLFTIARPTLSAASALTVTNAATVTILGAPQGSGAGPATITNPYSLWIQQGASVFQSSGSIEATNLPGVVTAFHGGGSAWFVARETSGHVETFIGSGAANGFVGTRTNHFVNFQTNATNQWQLTTGGNLNALASSLSVNIVTTSGDTQFSTSLSAGQLAFGPGGSTAQDCFWKRIGPNQIGIQNGTNSQHLFVYGSTAGNNYLDISHTAGGNATLLVGSSGTGLVLSVPAGNIYFQNTGVVNSWIVDTAHSALYTGVTLATNMVGGFINIPGAAGPPTGTPGNTTGFPLYWDSTNLQLYCYTGGAWKKSAAFT